jgi:hypothetical protein
VPKHWWIPMSPSRPEDRKKDVEDACERRKNQPKPPKLQSFWKTEDGRQLFALVKADQLDDNFYNEIRSNGDPVTIVDVR